MKPSVLSSGVTPDLRPNRSASLRAPLELLSRFDLVCFSHLRWDFVHQRPQHLLSRNAPLQRVFYLEEPVFDAPTPYLDVTRREVGVQVAVAHLPAGLPSEEVLQLERGLLDAFLAEQGVKDFIAWYYTPMALPFSDHLRPAATVYDCMDELSQFKDAPSALSRCEARLLQRADVVFTGGHSLYEAKRSQHSNIHPYPSSIDLGHFAQARAPLPDPADQAGIPGPRIGFFGVIDERLDTELLGRVARARPDWQLVMVGPTVKVDPASLPQGANLHYLGPKRYAELPAYLANWQVALLPFACNEATRFISPTKTPEYLAAAKPVVSTPIRDVVRPYGQRGLVRVAEDAEGFIAAIEGALEGERAGWLEAVDAQLSASSWDSTWAGMMARIATVLAAREPSVLARSA